MFDWSKLFKISVFLCASQQVFVSAGFPDGYNIISYWGQNSAGSSDSQKNLANYCDDTSDVIIIGFITNFNVGKLPTLNVANACVGSEFEGTGLLQCDHIGKDIKTCQDNGKKILLSLGGASGAYGFSNDEEGTTFAKTMWDLFGAGDSDTRPFGDAVVDGFDLDIEGGGSTGYTAFVKELRKLFKKDSSKDYYITAAPQCPFPDAMLGEVLEEADIDAINVQFYNNYCSTTSGSSFNFDAWHDWAQNKAQNKDAKVFVGIPGSESAAGTGFASLDTLKPIVEKVSASYKNTFGGITIWDASQSHGNTSPKPNFATAVAKLVHGTKGGSSSSNDNDDDSSSSSSDDQDDTSTTTTTTEKGKPTTTPTTTTTKEDDSSQTTTTTTTTSKPTSGSQDDDQIENDNASCIQDGDSCSEHGKYVCTGDGFAVCNVDQWVVTQCAVGLTCLSTTDGGSIYCAQTDGASDTKTCDAKTRKRSNPLLNMMAAPRPYKSSQVTAQLLVTHINKDNTYEAMINARRMDTKAFGSSVVVEMKMAPNTTVDRVTQGQVKQQGQTVKLQVKNPNKKSMSIVFTIAGTMKGEQENNVFVAPDVNSMKFMT